jgi:hypothetical protein
MRILLMGLMISLFSCSMYGPVSATSNPVGKKIGQACSKRLFSFIPLGTRDTSIHKAAKNGGISKISSVSSKYSFYLFTDKTCTIVNGN